MGMFCGEYHNTKRFAKSCIFYVGKCFCVRGGQEQRNLGPSNFRFLSKPGADPHCVVYEEHGSKNHPGGKKDFRAENKSVKCYAVPQNTPKCLVFLLNLYMKRLPTYAFENDLLYLRPKSKCPSDPDVPWYEEKPVGKNSLASMMKDVSAEAGISIKSNHSLRATGASNLFHANVPETLIHRAQVFRGLTHL